MSTLPYDLYRSSQVRELDRIAIEEHGLGDGLLMARAGQVAFEHLCRRWPDARCIVVVCGTGNNGGDGFVVARLAAEAGLAAEVVQVGDPSRIAGDALAARNAAAGAGIAITTFNGAVLPDADVIVDGLLGTGLSGEVVGEWGAAIAAINRSGKPVLALDIPSGLDGDSGAQLGISVKADMTVTFIGMKQGLLTALGPDCCGELVFADLDVPTTVYEKMPAAVERLDMARLQGLLTRRARGAHKGHFGHVLVVGGEHGMAGAVRMAAEAALRVGAGLVSVATRADHAALISSQRPEIMSHAVESTTELKPLLERASVVAVGPGLGQGAWGQAMLGHLIDSHKPLIVDADALNLLAEEPARHNNWILTPHPGEAARLLGCTSADIQQNRFAALASIEASFGGVCVLKGAGTLVLGEEGCIGLCSEGNPGMASGGMGDLLTGIIAGLMAQGFDRTVAARLGVCLHARAADRAAKEGGERGLLASDLLTWLRQLVNPTL